MYIGYVVMLAPDEFKDNKLVLKEMSSGQQSILCVDDIDSIVQALRCHNSNINSKLDDK